jgi:cytosine/adenosine deaminase-related metal-dependent hydrolase
MKKVVFLVFVPILFLAGCSSSEVFYKDALCIENISTVDPVAGLKEKQTVIIKSGRIYEIASTDELKLSEKNKIIDGSGKFLIPGLWDSHMHFAYIEELAPRMFDLFLAYGITSVRDTGGEISFVKKWKDKALANPLDAPRVMIAGPLLDGIPNVYDGSDPAHPPLSVGLNSVQAVVKQVNALDKAGVDFLKAYEMLSPEQFAMVIKLGKEKGLKVAGHVPLSIDVIIASNAGLNSMEHMRNLELSCASNADELLEQRRQFMNEGKEDPGGVLRSRIHNAQRKIAIQNYDENKAEEVLRVLARNHTWQIPTLTLNTASTEMPFIQDEWQESIRFLPDSIRRQWKKNTDSIKNRRPGPFRQQYSQWQFDMVKKIHQANIDIMAGTDCPIYYLTPGYSLHQELVMLVKAGLSPLDVLKSATLNPARYFNLENELGSIKEEFWADLVILDANPLENINNTKRINAVVKQGKYFSRMDLDQILLRLSKE